jgi:hypothetical protein
MRVAKGARKAPQVMTTALYLIVSGALIGMGISIIWRDVRARRRGNFVSERDVRLAADKRADDAEVEVTIAHGTEPQPAAMVIAYPTPLRVTRQPLEEVSSRRAPAAAAPRRDARKESHPAAPHHGLFAAAGLRPTEAPNDSTAPSDSEPRQGARLALEQQWSSMQPAIAAGVERTNGLLADIRLLVGPLGEPSWSYKNKGYGAYRRLLLAGESVAWLRLELLADGRLRASVKSHREDQAEVDATAETAAAGLDEDGAFSLCLRAAATYAARELRDSDERASEHAWKGVDALVTAALKATNGALAQAGARIIALAPAAWEGDVRRHRMALSVEVNGEDVARMHIEQLEQEMEVAVGVREPQLAALGRRRRIATEGMTIHALAELIAGCAWPTIARFRDARREA